MLLDELKTRGRLKQAWVKINVHGGGQKQTRRRQEKCTGEGAQRGSGAPLWRFRMRGGGGEGESFDKVNSRPESECGLLGGGA